MNINIPDKVMRNGKIINISKKEEVGEPIIISESDPSWVQDENGKWVKKPELEVKDIERNNN